MAHGVVKIIVDDDGVPRDPKWCLVDGVDAPRTFCGGEAFGYGESGAIFITKDVKRGGITCAKCLDRIAVIKDVRL